MAYDVSPVAMFTLNHSHYFPCQKIVNINSPLIVASTSDFLSSITLEDFPASLPSPHLEKVIA